MFLSRAPLLHRQCSDGRIGWLPLADARPARRLRAQCRCRPNPLIRSTKSDRAVPTLYQEARAVLQDSGFHARKSLGQNFLIHERVIDAILRLLALDPEDRVLEIGPGLGFLTRRLVEV